MLPTIFYIGLSVLLFVIGVCGVLLRRSTLMVFMSIELMLNSANLALVTFANQRQSIDAQIISLGLQLPQPKWLWGWRCW